MYSPLSLVQQSIRQHQERGFAVIITSSSWEGALRLSAMLPGTPAPKPMETVARMVYEADKAGTPLFSRPTLLVTGEMENLGHEGMAWHRIKEAANRHPGQVTFLSVSEDLAPPTPTPSARPRRRA